MKKVIATILKIGFSLSILAYIIWLVDFKEVTRIFRSADMTVLVIVFLLFLLTNGSGLMGGTAYSGQRVFLFL